MLPVLGRAGDRGSADSLAHYFPVHHAAHYGCGGVKAMLNGRAAIRQLPSLYEWLEGVGPAVVPARAASLHGDAEFRRAVEENVLLPIDHLISFESVRVALEAKKLALPGWVYDLQSARLSLSETDEACFIPVTEPAPAAI